MDLLIALPVLLMSVVVHEVAHAWVARREGDDTADRLGRITLNPVSHLDLWGSVIVPLLLFQFGGFIFGWAKPVPVNPANFRDPRLSDIKVSLAGIVSNMLLACLCTLLIVVAVKAEPLIGATAGDALATVGRMGLFINLILAMFNLIPIPPLDGSHVVYHLLPKPLGRRFRELGRYGILALLAVFWLAPGAFNWLLRPVYFFMDLSDAFIRLWI
jgi:Zn-dependent protease